MPTYEVRRRTPVLVSITVEAVSEIGARAAAREAWIADVKQAAMLAEVMRQPQRPDDSSDARSEARYDYSDTDTQTEQAEAARWATESAVDGTEA